MALSAEELSNLVKNLARYKFIVIAGLLGEGRISAWLNSIDDADLKTTLQLTLSNLNTELKQLFKAEDEKIFNGSKPPIQTNRDAFYQAMLGVTPAAINGDTLPGMQRQPTGQVQYALFNLHNSTDRSMGYKGDARVAEIEAKATTNIKKYFENHPSIAIFLNTMLSQLELASLNYNAHLVASYKKLQHALQETRHELKQDETEGSETEPEEEATQEEPETPNDTPTAPSPESVEPEQPSVKRTQTLQQENYSPSFLAPPLQRSATVPSTQHGEIQQFVQTLEEAKRYLSALR